jgi:hypothetical protein
VQGRPNLPVIVATIWWLLAQSPAPPPTLPPAYPRAGTTKILDNDRVQVWNIAWLKGQASPLHRHIYDLVGVYYEPGGRMIISPEGAKRPVSTKAWDISFQRKDVTRIEEGTSDAPLRSIFVEMKKQEPYGTASASKDAPAFSGAGATQKLDNDRVSVWECIGPITPSSDTLTSTTRSSSSSTRRARTRRGSLKAQRTPTKAPAARRACIYSKSSERFEDAGR